MRKFVLAAAITGAALTSTACSDTAEDATDVAAEDAMADSDAVASVKDAAGDSSVLDANTATAEQLAGVNGVSPELAEAIVSGQPYASAMDLRAGLLETLSEDEATSVLARVFVPVNLNSASREEIELIPGMTERMVHEFEEYRPYEDMNEFNREIGKYVDEAEVARFRNYVTL
jgi:DNA uptake protein ComE-like DNA-binding protein